MRTRNKRITLVQTIPTVPFHSQFIEHDDMHIPMKLIHTDIYERQELAEIVYTARVAKPAVKKQEAPFYSYRSVMEVLGQCGLQKRNQESYRPAGKIVRLSSLRSCRQRNDTEESLMTKGPEYIVKKISISQLIKQQAFRDPKIKNIKRSSPVKQNIKVCQPRKSQRTIKTERSFSLKSPKQMKSPRKPYFRF